MSEPGPESIPASADARRKPAKRPRRDDPISQQAATVEALFAKPDQEIKIPSSELTTNSGRAPPEIVSNVQGSSAGAGSGEFHVYKASRRREYERLRAMDEEVEKEKEDELYEREAAERRKKDEEETAKKRRKREMKKMKGKKGKGGQNAGEVEKANSKIQERADAGGDEKDDGKEDAGRTGQAAEAVATKEEEGLIIHDDD